MATDRKGKKNKKLKIGLLLDTSLDPNDGVQQYVTTLGEWLRGQGHDVHYLVGQTRYRKLPNVHSLARNISVRFNGNRTSIPLPASWRRLRRFIAEEQFDVLHVQTPHSPFLAQPLILSASPETAVVGTFHIAPFGWWITATNWALGLVLKPSLARLDTLVSVSPAAAAFARKTFGLASEVVPNVIDYQWYHEAKPLPQYASDDVATILFLGRLVPRKGAQTLLAAAAELANDKNVPPFRVVVCGDGPLKKTLKHFVAARPALAHKVEFVGYVDEALKPRYYASADIAVFPATGGESFGIVLLEAMASGRAAVLAGDNPGYRSVLQGRPELLFDAHSSHLLAKKIKKYLLEPQSHTRAQAWGAKQAQNFDVTKVGHELLKIYDAALRKRRGR